MNTCNFPRVTWESSWEHTNTASITPMNSVMFGFLWDLRSCSRRHKSVWSSGRTLNLCSLPVTAQVMSFSTDSNAVNLCHMNESSMATCSDRPTEKRNWLAIGPSLVILFSTVLSRLLKRIQCRYMWWDSRSILDILTPHWTSKER